jgi:dUTP pyrophosphatase
MKMKIKKLSPEAVLPARAKEGDAGYDVIAIADGVWSKDKTYIEYSTGLSVELPIGYHVELFPRSSISKTDLLLANSIGLVDNGYRGELLLRFKYVHRHTDLPTGEIPMSAAIDHVMAEPILYKKGDKIGQIVVRKTYELPVEEVSELSDSDRGTGGFGSTG